jgi:hypothetical protein
MSVGVIKAPGKGVRGDMETSNERCQKSNRGGVMRNIMGDVKGERGGDRGEKTSTYDIEELVCTMHTDCTYASTLINKLHSWDFYYQSLGSVAIKMQWFF